MFVYYNSADDKSRGEELFLTHTKVSVHVICIISEPGEGTYIVSSVETTYWCVD